MLTSWLLLVLVERVTRARKITGLRKRKFSPRRWPSSASSGAQCRWRRPTATTGRATRRTALLRRNVVADDGRACAVEGHPPGLQHREGDDEPVNPRHAIHSPLGVGAACAVIPERVNVGHRNWLASLYVKATRLSAASHVLNSARTSTACFRPMSRNALPTDFRTYSLSSARSAARSSIASSGRSRKNGRAVQM